MGPVRQITVELPADLLERAQQASVSDVTRIVIEALQALIATRSYEQLRRARGKVHFSRTATELKGGF